jgi:hypothetical protein
VPFVRFFVRRFNGTNNAYNNGQGYGLTIGFPALDGKPQSNNVGLDFEFFKSFFTGSFDYYNKQTNDLYI